ncbi:MAG: glycoside hydrolase family 9 protein [Bacteroidales bacterium]|jgi:peptidoglycan/xylan/chitin deacetylase (PgdA/CDA1 family)|nr:glycoside hydrolase family 9 protein [Bacteroidales bacterium]
MKKTALTLLIVSITLVSSRGDSWIRINQLGYLPGSVKVAVYISQEQESISSFNVCEALTGKVVFKGKASLYDGSAWGMASAARLDFSGLQEQGGYYILYGKTMSETFRIGSGIYAGTADFILNYIRQQRCGYNPFLADSCHVHDGIIVDHPTLAGTVIDVMGGYHDASDHLRYTATTSTAIYQMMFAWLRAPEVYGDSHDAAGSPGANGIPDILDEVRWGLEWLLKMNPDSGVMYNQVADDRDHRGFRLPNHDEADYGLGPYRPVYYVTGKPQGLAKYKNRTEGVASTAGKFASVFAMGAKIFTENDRGFAERLAAKADDAYEFAQTNPGATQTACFLSPYFYEEDNYVDDMELAAWELYTLTGEKYYLEQADYWGTLEPFTPWIVQDTARHYQFYPFVNLGHANLGLSATEYSQKYIDFLRRGLELINSRDMGDVFQVKIPFVWCSNNYVSAALTQCRLYREATGDTRFDFMEAAMRDWLFGCNPWGTSMICGLPAGGDYPLYPHSAVTLYLGKTTTGGLVDGPVYRGIYENLRGLTLLRADPYNSFQNGNVVYHDDIGDYSTNEPTLDGTASLSYYLSSLEKEGRSRETGSPDDLYDSHGAMIRKGSDEKTIYLVFSADEYGEGFEHILNVLDGKGVKGSFFLTGNFLRNKEFASYVKRIISGGHYLGPHSDGHLLYVPWENRDTLLVTKDQFNADIRDNYAALRKSGLKIEKLRYFLAPYEWYNSAIARWSAEMGMTLVNLTPGTGTNADYTTPDMVNYRTSDQLIERLERFEESSPEGLNGAIILIHPGTAPERTDRLYLRLEEIISFYSAKGYIFNSL